MSAYQKQVTFFSCIKAQTFIAKTFPEMLLKKKMFKNTKQVQKAIRSKGTQMPNCLVDENAGEELRYA